MYCGVAKAVMNPPIGTYLSGYAAERPCEGIHDPIHAKVLAFGEQTADQLIISLDLVGVDADYVKELREKIRERYNVPADKIMIHTTHTHSGPGGTIKETSIIWKAFKSWMPYDAELVLIQHEKILLSVGKAIESMEPCSVYYGSGVVDGIAANRVSPDREYNPELQVVEFRKTSGKRIIVYHFACHPTILHAENLQVSADFPGASSSYLEANENVEAALFLNGPCGDISTRFTRRQTNFDEVNRIGRNLSAKVIDVLGTATPVTSLKSNSIRFKMELKIRSFQSPQIMQARLEELQDAFREAESKNYPQAELRRMESEIEGASFAVELANKIRGNSSLEAEIQILQLGELYFLGIPGELFYETGRQIKDTFELTHSTGHLLIMGNTNDYIGYIVPEQYYTSRSYESTITLLQEGSSELIENSALFELMKL